MNHWRVPNCFYSDLILFCDAYLMSFRARRCCRSLRRKTLLWQFRIALLKILLLNCVRSVARCANICNCNSPEQVFCLIWVKDLEISLESSRIIRGTTGLLLVMDSQRTMPFWRAFEGATSSSTSSLSVSNSFSQPSPAPIYSQRLNIKEEPICSESPSSPLPEPIDNNVSARRSSSDETGVN